MSVGTKTISLEKCYRLPWNMADNAITWLEPTTKCNIYCEGCYRANDPDGHKPLGDVISDLEHVKRMRRTGGISIAGGEPLIYPDIIPLVRYVKSQGWKPIIITNGTALTPELIKELRKAGLVGFTVHVDSHQRRPGWIDKSEIELNELRLQYASMIHEAGKGKLHCAFNATIYPDSVQHISALTKWAQDHIDLVQTMVYILFRCVTVDPRFDYMIGGRKLDESELDLLRYKTDHADDHTDVLAPEVTANIREACPAYEPCAFLNSNVDGGVPKWLLAMRVGRKDKILGYMDGKFMELTQSFHHLVFGTYLAYVRPWATKSLQGLFPLAPFNKSIRKLFKNWLLDFPGWFKSMYMQTILVLQPPDILADGKQAMCDGCPDAMYYKGKLLWKCRLDEVQKFGDFLQHVPKAQPDVDAGEVEKLKAEV